MGKVNEICRYPVKSFAGEQLASCEIDTYGLYGDRFGAFYDETLNGWDSYFTARDIPEMLSYKAMIEGNNLSVRSPDGRTFGWNEDLLKEIQKYSRKKVSMTRFKAPNRETLELMAVDTASVLMITDRSIRNLESIWGKRIDARRFRANFVVTLHDPCDESDWIGKRLRIGDAELQVDHPCERCSVIAIDPDTLERDTSLLKKVNEELNLNFGVYASVAKTGRVHVGDSVYVIN